MGVVLGSQHSRDLFTTSNHKPTVIHHYEPHSMSYPLIINRKLPSHLPSGKRLHNYGLNHQV